MGGMDTQTAAATFAETTRRFQSGAISAEEFRATIAPIRDRFTDAEWTQIKARATFGLTGGKLN